MSETERLLADLSTQPAINPPPEEELEPLPVHMHHRPFGRDEKGQPIRQVSGSSVQAVIAQMQMWVDRHVAQELDGDVSDTERRARVAAARDAALDELAARLNAAIPDPDYHVTRDSLLNTTHQYSHEFHLYVDEFARQISGDQDLSFHSGLRSIPPSLVHIGRLLSLRQLYSTVPRLTARVSDADIRVTGTTAHSAVLQWHPERQLAALPQEVHRRYMRMACQVFQAAYTVLPLYHSGLPAAQVQERRCVLRGDPYCEWEFTWQSADERSLLPARSALNGPGRTATPARAIEGAPRRDDGWQEHYEEELTICPAPVPAAMDEFPPLPAYMANPPFGADAQGRPIRDVSGALIVATVEQVQKYVGRMTADGLPQLSAEERQARIAAAQDAAVAELVQRLNAAMPDPDNHVSRDYLLNPRNYYSFEFVIYANELARQISGDMNWAFHRGMRSIPVSMLHLARPLSLQQVYSLLPRFVSMVVADEIRVVSTTPTSAVIQMDPRKQLAALPEVLHQRVQYTACQAYQGAFAVIPWVLRRDPIAKVKERRCVLRGDECCEWEMTWENPAGRPGLGLWIGAVAAVAFAAYSLLRLPAWQWLAVGTALLPAAIGWLLRRNEAITADRDEQNRLLMEQRESAEQQFDDLQQANAELQLSNITLQHRLSELTALHEIGVILSATLGLDELLEKSLHAVIEHLHFDRALLMLVDEERGILTHGHSIGGTPQMTAMMRQYQVPLASPDSIFARVVRSRAPMLINVDAEEQGATVQPIIEALQTNRLLAVPLMSQGKAIGVMAVDNAPSGRPIPDNSEELLVTVGTQVAAAIDGARLRQTLEQRVEQRTAEGPRQPAPASRHHQFLA